MIIKFHEFLRMGETHLKVGNKQEPYTLYINFQYFTYLTKKILKIILSCS